MYNLTSVVSSVDDNLGQPADGTCLTEHKPGNLAGTTHHRRSCWLKISMQSLNDCGEKALSPLWSVGGWENRTVARVARTGLAAKETAAKEHERCNRVLICAEVYSPLTKIVSVHLLGRRQPTLSLNRKGGPLQMLEGRHGPHATRRTGNPQ